MVVAASLCYALSGFFLKRRLRGCPAIGLVTATMVASTAYVLPLALLSLPDAAPDLETVGSMAVLGFGGTGVAFVLFYSLISEVGPGARGARGLRGAWLRCDLRRHPSRRELHSRNRRRARPDRRADRGSRSRDGALPVPRHRPDVTHKGDHYPPGRASADVRLSPSGIPLDGPAPIAKVDRSLTRARDPAHGHSYRTEQAAALPPRRPGRCLPAAGRLHAQRARSARRGLAVRVLQRLGLQRPRPDRGGLLPAPCGEGPRRPRRVAPPRRRPAAVGRGRDLQHGLPLASARAAVPVDQRR